VEYPKIIAVDFDGTIVENAFPEIGKLKEAVAEKIRKEKEKGATIILYTCRRGKDLEEAVEFCKANNIPIDYVNRDADQIVEAFAGGDFEGLLKESLAEDRYVKPFANEYIDDRAINVEDWIKEDKLKEKDIFAGELRKEDMVWPEVLEMGYEKYISTTAWKLARWACLEKNRVKAFLLKKIADKIEGKKRNSSEHSSLLIGGLVWMRD